MDINEFKIEIGKRLSGDFEHDLFNAALYNLNDVDNKLRLLGYEKKRGLIPLFLFQHICD